MVYIIRFGLTKTSYLLNEHARHKNIENTIIINEKNHNKNNLKIKNAKMLRENKN